ncbi:MAG: hypothetical protein JWM31_1193 [Solirubrobacterales bacterium]|nr:hypothetical protein [Solirubrobacterales bacterium]
MNSRNPRRRPPREISDSQRSMLTQMHRDVEPRLVPAEIMGFYERAVAGEPVTQREVQRIIDAFREHQKPADELPLYDKQLWWVEKLSGEAAAEAAEQLTRDQFPRLVLEGLEQTYGTRDFEEIMELPVATVKKWAAHLVGGTSLLFGSAQRERQLTLIQAAVQARDLQAPMKRLYQDVTNAAKRAEGGPGDEDEDPADG